MFTGLIEHQGTIERVTPGPMTDVWVGSEYDAFAHGESIACDGVCLTVVEWRGRAFRVQAAPETLRRTTLGTWAPGTKVNLEKAMKVGDRLGGHWVQGHVDATATVRAARPDGGSWAMEFDLPVELAPFFVEKGSVCIDGVSLTVTQVGASTFGVMLIPETQARTSLGQKRPGQRVNLEADIVGKYVARMMGLRGGLTREQLAAAGFPHA
jgi:riboflavin synthase